MSGRTVSDPEQTTPCDKLFPVGLAEQVTHVDLVPDATYDGTRTVCSLVGDANGEIVHVELTRRCAPDASYIEDSKPSTEEQRAAFLIDGTAAVARVTAAPSQSTERWNARHYSEADKCAYEVEGTMVNEDTVLQLLAAAVGAGRADA